MKVKPKSTEACNHDTLTETDKTIIAEVTSAYEQTAVKVPIKEPIVSLSRSFVLIPPSLDSNFDRSD